MLTILNIIGWIKGHARYVLTGIAILVLLIAVAFTYRWCQGKPKLDEKAIQKAQQAIAKEDRKVMVEILAESDAKEAEIDGSIKAIEQKTEEAKKNYLGKTNQELADELNARSKE